MSDEEYDDYGDYGSEEEQDYGDEGFDDENYQYADETPIVDFAFRDIGAEGRIGGPVDEDLGIPMGTMIAGAIGQAQRRHEMMYMDPRVQFSMDVQRILNTETSLNLSDSDKSVIKKTIAELPFIRFKNALTYVLGYYIQMEMRDDQRVSSYLTAKLNRLSKITGNDDRITVFEVMKYARYWKLVLLKK